MSVNYFHKDEVKRVMESVQTKASDIKKILDNCDSIVTANVGVENKWSGERANRYKKDWDKAASEFQSVVDLINRCAEWINSDRKEHINFENNG